MKHQVILTLSALALGAHAQSNTMCLGAWDGLAVYAGIPRVCKFANTFYITDRQENFCDSDLPTGSPLPAITDPEVQWCGIELSASNFCNGKNVRMEPRIGFDDCRPGGGAAEGQDSVYAALLDSNDHVVGLCRRVVEDQHDCTVATGTNVWTVLMRCDLDPDNLCHLDEELQ